MSRVWPSFTTDRVWLSTESIAFLLDVVDHETGKPNLRAVRERIARRKLPHKYFGRELRYHIDDVQSLLTNLPEFGR